MHEMSALLHMAHREVQCATTAFDHTVTAARVPDINLFLHAMPLDVHPHTLFARPRSLQHTAHSATRPSSYCVKTAAPTTAVAELSRSTLQCMREHHPPCPSGYTDGALPARATGGSQLLAECAHRQAAHGRSSAFTVWPFDETFA
ncbi:hypothetical protein CFE70_004530 [Pyrenophora teres f. teres 0-1]